MKVSGKKPFALSLVLYFGANILAHAAVAPADFIIDFIGDSHSDYYGNPRGTFGFFGQHLGELMAAENDPFSLYAASSSIPNWWFNTTPVQAAIWGYTQSAASPHQGECTYNGEEGTCVPKLNQILYNSPDLFVIEQGTNLFGYSSSFVISQIQTMLAEIQGQAKQCLWVGAPNADTSVDSQASQDLVWQLISQYASAACYVYNSRFVPETDANGNPLLDVNGNLIIDVPLPYQAGPTNDGEHLSMAAAGTWAVGVGQMIDWIRNRTTP